MPIVVPYSIATLIRLLAEKSKNTVEVVKAKLHSTYFEEYFANIRAATIVIEDEYVDRDFLEDFAAYYVRCFHPYDRYCSRLHFFGLEFDEREFDLLLRGAPEKVSAKALNDSYCGFIVVKPLPETIIGRTCLKKYPDDGGRRHYPITRKYDANLFGQKITVDTLAYQEQDRVAAACATSALWCAFQGTGILFQHTLQSPVEITKVAVSQSPIETRSLPNEGLSAAQMGHAIRSVGLEPLLVKVENIDVLKTTVYAYLNGGIPLLLLINLVGLEKPGKHAVAVTGYSLGHPSPSPSGKTGFVTMASRINKLYVHDDQVGPFARMEMDGVTVKDASGTDWMSLSTSWPDASGMMGGVRAVPESVIIPLYHKIRIPFATIHDDILHFDEFVTQAFALAGPPSIRLQWDVRLTTAGKAKSEIAEPGYPVPPEVRRSFLLKNMPRFMWRATGECQGSPVLDLFFDATDIERGDLLVRSIEYHPTIRPLLRAACNFIPTASYSSRVRRILSGYASQP